jgi:hypothetical protein
MPPATRKKKKIADSNKENVPTKKTAVNRAKLQGRLSVLPTMPLDVLFEVCLAP